MTRGALRRALLLAAASVAAPLSLSAAAPAASQPRKPLVVITGKTIALDVGAKSATERLGVRVAAGVKTHDLHVRVARVTRGSSRRADYAAAFSAAFVPTGERPDALRLKVDTTKLRRPGSYTLALRVSTLKGGRVTAVLLKLVVRPARLRTPSTININRTLPVFGGHADVDGEPSLGNRSVHTWIPHLTATVVDGPKQNGQPARGTLKFAGGSYNPGARGVLAVKKVDLPVGTTTGVVELNAPELERPIRVPFTVVSKRPDWLIVLVVVLGLVLGTLGRTTLGVVARRTHTRGAALWLRSTLDDEIATERDKTLKSALEDARKPLDRLGVLATTTAATTKTASDGREKAYADYTKRHDETRAMIEPLRAEVTRHSRVDDVDRQYATARQALKDATDSLDRRDVDAATTSLETAREALVPKVEEAADAWSHAVQDLLGTIGTTSATLGLKDRQTQVEALSAGLGTVPPAPTDGADAAARAGNAADAADAALRTIEPFVRAATSTARANADAAAKRLSASTAPSASADRTSLVAAADQLHGTRWDEASCVGELDRRLADLGRQLDDIEQRYPATPAPTGPAPAPVTLGEQKAATAAATEVALVAMAPGGGGTGTPIVAAAAAETPAPFEAPSVAGLATLAIVGLLRFLIFAAVLSLLGYFIFRDGFQGTWSEMINIFLWAFFTDVAVSSVEPLRSRLPGLPPASAAITTPSTKS